MKFVYSHPDKPCVFIDAEATDLSKQVADDFGVSHVAIAVPEHRAVVIYNPNSKEPVNICGEWVLRSRLMGNRVRGLCIIAGEGSTTQEWEMKDVTEELMDSLKAKDAHLYGGK